MLKIESKFTKLYLTQTEEDEKAKHELYTLRTFNRLSDHQPLWYLPLKNLCLFYWNMHFQLICYKYTYEIWNPTTFTRCFDTVPTIKSSG